MGPGELMGDVKGICFAGSGAVGVVSASVPPALVDAVQAAAVEDEPFPALVTVLSSMGIAKLPGFALAAVEGERLRVLARHPFTCEVVRPDLPADLVDGSGMGTWCEQTFDVPASIRISGPGGLILVASTAALARPPTAGPAPVAAADKEARTAASAEVSGSVGVAAMESDAVVVEPVPGAALLAESSAPGASADESNALSSEDTILPNDDGPGLSDREPVASPTPGSAGPSEADILDHTELREPGQVASAAVRSGSDATRTWSDDAPAPEAAPVPERLVTVEAPVVGVPPGLITAIPFASPPAAAPAESAGFVPGVDGDHDGHTVARVPSVPASGAPAVPPTSLSLDGIAPVVQAVLCPAGHPNPLHLAECRICGAGPLDGPSVRVPRPSMGQIRISTGQVVDLVRSVIVGRNPTAPANEEARFQLVTVPSPDLLVSRSHVEVRLEEWSIYVVDLDARNGTIVRLPGREPQRLRPRQPMLVGPGTTVDLAGAAGLAFERPLS
jgi:hypothetical protein